MNQHFIENKLLLLGNTLLKKEYKNNWSKENPTYGYCYILSEALYHFSKENYTPPMFKSRRTWNTLVFKKE